MFIHATPDRRRINRLSICPCTACREKKGLSRTTQEESLTGAPVLLPVLTSASGVAVLSRPLTRTPPNVVRVSYPWVVRLFLKRCRKHERHRSTRLLPSKTSEKWGRKPAMRGSGVPRSPITITLVRCCLENALLVFQKRNNLRSQKGQMIIPVSGRSPALKRRSARIPLNSSVSVSGEDRSKASFTIGAKATNLNKHGGAIQVARELLVGTTVLVRNKRGKQISARVVSQINAEQGPLRYGIEFVEEDTRAANFWGITFPSNA